MVLTNGSKRSPRATGAWKWYDVLKGARASSCCPNVGWWNGPLLGSDVVVVTARIMSVAQTQAHRCCGSVPFTSCSSDSNPPMSLRHSATGLRHSRLFGEALRAALSPSRHLAGVWSGLREGDSVLL